MLRHIARAMVIALLVIGLRAAQGPNNSQGSSATTKPIGTTEARKTKSQPYQVGTASWYGEYFDGKPTASGEDYDMYDLTAAHPSLPLGTYVKVTNLHNGRAVVVKVNDRGPVVPGRIIDLSYGAAQVLHFEDRGLQKVRLDLVKPKASRPEAYQTVAYNSTGGTLLRF
jgi:rare lipoprotein A